MVTLARLLEQLDHVRHTSVPRFSEPHEQVLHAKLPPALEHHRFFQQELEVATGHQPDLVLADQIEFQHGLAQLGLVREDHDGLLVVGPVCVLGGEVGGGPEASGGAALE